MCAQMSKARLVPTMPVPERMWYANTNMKSFSEAPREPADRSAFAYWLASGKLIVAPKPPHWPHYHRALAAMRPGDPVFAYEDRVGFVAIGRVKEEKMHCTTSGGSTLYPDPSRMIDSIDVEWDTSITRHYQEVTALTRVGGHAIQRCDSSMGLYSLLLGMLQEAHDRYRADPEASEAAAIERIAGSPNYGDTMREQIGQARIGQGTFRAAVLALEPRCRVTGTAHARHLVASHIKPWAVCADGEHLDGANGLMLAPHVDHLFDTGLISFTDDGQLLLAPALDRSVLQAWHIDEDLNVGPFSVDQARYLAHHRHYVLGQPRQRRQRNVAGGAPDGAHAVDHVPHDLADVKEMN